jgi:hypothetical protein
LPPPPFHPSSGLTGAPPALPLPPQGAWLGCTEEIAVCGLPLPAHSEPLGGPQPGSWPPKAACWCWNGHWPRRHSAPYQHFFLLLPGACALCSPCWNGHCPPLPGQCGPFQHGLCCAVPARDVEKVFIGTDCCVQPVLRCGSGPTPALEGLGPGSIPFANSPAPTCGAAQVPHHPAGACAWLVLIPGAWVQGGGYGL